jgi:hypothetical protein
MIPIFRVLSSGYSRATNVSPWVLLARVGGLGVLDGVVGTPNARNPLWPSLPRFWESAAVCGVDPERVSGHCFD